MTKIKNRFAELVAEKERREGRKWTYEDIRAETGVAMGTLSAYAQNRVRRFDAVTLKAFMAFFGCGISDLLVVETDEYPEKIINRLL